MTSNIPESVEHAWCLNFLSIEAGTVSLTLECEQS